ncbi:uroporphyrinogen-III synthase [Oerskovia flava]|uniref:uroporphyrinogen-III synthase n=1 Tax=Oerskovia flava TaxID=2986422 RepID=UPI0022403A55|nr:uroporphyrinogen-III synthase [Oerskovia sp. JB1-3-2]
MTPGRLRDPARHPVPARPLDRRTVLVPRPADRGARLAGLLRAQGARVVLAPAIERAPITNTAPVDAAVQALADGAFAWVVVTSVNAIDELRDAAARLGVPLAPPDTADGVRWAAVGPATRRALEAQGVQVALEPRENSARGLLAAFGELGEAGGPTSSGAPGSTDAPLVLVPQGDLAAPTMAEGLAELGYAPHVVTVYRTVAHDLPEAVVRSWRSGTIHAVVLTSGSVAREVARQLGPDPAVAGVAIGEPTARAARAAGLRLDAVAAAATDDALAAAVLSALAGADPTSPPDRPDDAGDPT